jgi:hypothetical protein
MIQLLRHICESSLRRAHATSRAPITLLSDPQQIPACQAQSSSRCDAAQGVAIGISHSDDEVLKAVSPITHPQNSDL